MCNTNSLPEIIGKIEIPNQHSNNIVCCDDCKIALDNSFGDPREKVTTTFADNTISIRMLCKWCINDLFEEYEPNNIFEGTPDWQKML